jgi:hypothetical protein
MPETLRMKKENYGSLSFEAAECDLSAQETS